MKTELLLRISNPRFLEAQLILAQILERHYKIKLVDDSNMTSKFESVFDKYSKVISLSADIKCPRPMLNYFQIFKISRVFDRSGRQIGWSIPVVSKKIIALDYSIGPISTEEKVCVIDTDIATGSTKEMMAKLFPCADFFAPIKLAFHQDLIDIEDLIDKRTLIWESGNFLKVDYFLNQGFFKMRTSLELKFYVPVFEALKSLAKPIPLGLKCSSSGAENY